MNITEFKEEHLQKVQEWKDDPQSNSIPSSDEDFSYLYYKKSYKKILGKVKDMRTELESGRKLNAENDKDFLTELLLEDSNGIAVAGNGVLIEEHFENLIKDIEILNAIEEVIKDPSAETSEKLGDAIRTCNRKNGHQRMMDFGNGEELRDLTNNWLITNRVVAACTEQVSTTVDRKKFCKVIDFLVKGNIIENYADRCSSYKEMKEQEWYNENIELMTQLKEMFKKEIENGSTDTYLLNIFIWYIIDKHIEGQNESPFLY